MVIKILLMQPGDWTQPLCEFYLVLLL